MDADVLYSPSRWVTIGKDIVVRVHVEKTTELSQQNRKNIEYSVHHSASDKVVELFGSKQLPRNSPIVAYVTGGYWSELSGEVSAYTVGPLHAEGIVTAVLHYDRAPGVSLTEIVTQVRDGIAWVLDYATEHGAPVILCGHSAGSHLTAMALSSPTMQSRRSPLRAVYHMAGVYDLKPLVGTEITKPLNLTMEEAIANSPMSEANLDEYCKTMVDATTRIVYGHQECPGLRSQNKDLAKLLEARKMRVQVSDLPEVDHFNLTENLADGNYTITREMIETAKGLKGKI